MITVTLQELKPRRRNQTELHSWEVKEIEERRAKMTDPAKVKQVDGVLYWSVSDAPIPPHVFKDAFIECSPAQAAAYKVHLDGFFAQYRASQPAQPSSEERFEARAAFGPGQTVVDAITGRKFTT
tara:strand:- start:109 stop:483 length:375 start_codon:yes stop_codon:yes gene_type:complete